MVLTHCLAAGQASSRGSLSWAANDSVRRRVNFEGKPRWPGKVTREPQYWSDDAKNAATKKAREIAAMAANHGSEMVFRAYLREVPAKPDHAHWSMYNDPKDPYYYAKDEIDDEIF